MVKKSFGALSKNFFSHAIDLCLNMFFGQEINVISNQYANTWSKKKNAFLKSKFDSLLQKSIKKSRFYDTGSAMADQTK